MWIVLISRQVSIITLLVDSVENWNKNYLMNAYTRALFRLPLNKFVLIQSACINLKSFFSPANNLSTHNFSCYYVIIFFVNHE